jgi:hypothetical protein
MLDDLCVVADVGSPLVVALAPEILRRCSADLRGDEWISGGISSSPAATFRAWAKNNFAGRCETFSR